MSYRLQIGMSSRVCAGESVCGDKAGIYRKGYEVFLAVVDGLGHGPEANRAACVACKFLEKNWTSDIGSVLEELDSELVSTRGAAATLIYVDTRSGELCHTGIGNVKLSGRCKDNINPFPVPGVLGSGIRKIMISRHQLHDGDFFVVYSDGISQRFDVGDYIALQPQLASEKIIEKWSRSHDDATCVTVQVRN